MRASMAALLAFLVLASLPQAAAPDRFEREARRWVDRTLAGMSLSQRIGQVLFPGIDSTYTSYDSQPYERYAHAVRVRHAGGVVMFGGAEPVPPVLLNPAYSPIVLGHPLEAAVLLNSLQRLAQVPLLAAADFEWGLGMRIAGTTSFPRAMAMSAAGDPALTEAAARAIGEEARAIGVHLDFAPVADVNNNPRNPVINTRSFGEDPQRVATQVAAFVRGLMQGGAGATLKHFPGHGDTDVDTHIGLARIPHDRERLDLTELRPFRAGLAAGAEAVMVGHLLLPAIDPAPDVPATFSAPIIEGLLRDELGFDGLVITDSLKMQAVAGREPPGVVAVRAFQAGNDVLLDIPDVDAAASALEAAVSRGEIAPARLERSVRRVLEAKARRSLHRERLVDVSAVPAKVGTRAHRALAQELSDRAVTLVRDDRNLVPVSLPSDATVVVLSILDYLSGWRFGAPMRTLIPELKARWPSLTAIELSDRTSREELELTRTLALGADLVVAAVSVRAASASGRMDLAPGLVTLLRSLTAPSARPKVVTVFFGNPYVVTTFPAAPAALLTYDFGDHAERSAARALKGEIPVRGTLPIELPGMFPIGHGLTRGATSANP